MIIGISGLANSGKDTCADFLVRRKGFAKVALADPLKRMARDVYGFSIDQLWGPSKMRNAPDGRYPREHGPFLADRCACCGAYFDEKAWQSLPAFQEESRKRQCFLTPRFALQQLGSECGRMCYPNTWIDYALRVAEVLSDGNHGYDPVSSANTLFRLRVDSLARRNVVIPDIRFKNEVVALKAADAKLIRVVRPNAGLGGAAGAHVSETEQAEILDSEFDGVIVNDGTLAELEEMVVNFAEKWKGTDNGS